MMSGTTIDMAVRLNSLMDYIQSNAQKATDFAVTQGGDIARQIVLWGIWSNFILAGVIFIIIGICIFLLNKLCWKNEDAGFDDKFVWTAFIFLFLAIPLVLGTMFFIYGLKASIAPKLYLIEYVSDIIHDNRN